MENDSLILVGTTTVLTDGMHLLTTLAQMTEHQQLWRDLDRRSTAPLVWFQSFEWCCNWVRHHRGNNTPYILMLVENGKAVAVLPLMRGSNRWGIRSLRILGDPHSQYGNLLTESGVISNKQAMCFEHALAANDVWDCLLCNHVPAGSALEQVIGKARRLKLLDNQSLVVDLGQHASFAAYEASLSKNSAKNLRRRRKHLEDVGALNFRVLRPTDEGYAAALDGCIALKQLWLAATGRVGAGLKQVGFAEVLKSIRMSPNCSDGPLAFVLSVAEKVVAVEMGFLQRGHYYSYIGAFDLHLRQHAPGRLQVHETIGWLLGQGAVSMDLLANPTDYKRDVANLSISLSSFARSRTLLGALYVSFWAGWGKPKLKRAFATIPEPWRAAFNTMRKSEYKANA